MIFRCLEMILDDIFDDSGQILFKFLENLNFFENFLRNDAKIVFL